MKRNSWFKFLAVFVLLIGISSQLLYAMEVQKAPVIKSLHSYKTKNPSEPSTFKIYIDGYNQDLVRVKKSGLEFKTKYYVYEEDSIILQKEFNDYRPEYEFKTTQAIDLGKKYYAQVEFISYDKDKYRAVDTKSSEKKEFKFATSIKTTEGEKDSKDTSKVYVKTPKILSASYKGNKVDFRLDDYNQVYAEIKNNGEFFGEITVFERKLNSVKTISKTEFTDYSMDRSVQLSAPLSSNNEYVLVVRYGAIANGQKVFSPTSNEVILKEKLNTEKYNPKYLPNFLELGNITYLFPNDDAKIEPERPITRGEVALAFYSLLDGKTKAEYYAKNNLFMDSIPSKFNESISTIAKMRIINGYEDNTFKASNPITRAEFVTIAMKFYSDNINGYASFKDVSNNFWGKSAISKAVAIGIINGYEDGTFKPNNPITRAEAAKIINRITGRVGFESQYKNKYIDNAPSKWYYEEIKVAN